MTAPEQEHGQSTAGRTCAFLGAASLACGYVVFSLWRSVVEDSSRNENEIPMEAPVAWLAGLASVGLAGLALLVGLSALAQPGVSRKQVLFGVAMGLVGAATSLAIILRN